MHAFFQTVTTKYAFRSGWKGFNNNSEKIQMFSRRVMMITEESKYCVRFQGTFSGFSTGCVEKDETQGLWQCPCLVLVTGLEFGKKHPSGLENVC